MALLGQVIALSTTATLIFSPATGRVDDPTPILLVNTSTTTSMYIGGTAVQSSGTAGVPLATGASIALSLMEGDNVYAVAAAGAPNIAILLGRQ